MNMNYRGNDIPKVLSYQNLSVNSLLRIRSCYSLRALGICLYAWAGILVMALVQSLFHGFSFISFSFWKSTFMCSLCIVASAVPLFWTTQPRDSSVWRVKMVLLRFVFVLFSGCASYFASAFLGQALGIHCASFSSTDIISLRFACHSVFSGLVAAIGLWCEGKLSLDYPKEPERRVDRYIDSIKKNWYFDVIRAFCTWFCWSILGGFMEGFTRHLLGVRAVSVPSSLSDHVCMMLSVLCIQFVQMFCFKAVIISVTDPVDFVSPDSIFSNGVSSIHPLVEAVKSDNYEVKMAGFFALAFFVRDDPTEKTIARGPMKRSLLFNESSRMALTDLLIECKKVISIFNEAANSNLNCARRPQLTQLTRSTPRAPVSAPFHTGPILRLPPVRLPKDAQIVRWAIDSVRILMIASRTEDEFKILQQVNSGVDIIREISKLSTTLQNMCSAGGSVVGSINKIISKDQKEIFDLNEFVRDALQKIPSSCDYSFSMRSGIPIDPEINALRSPFNG